MSKNIDQIAEDLSSLTVIEMSKLKELLEDKWGVKAQAAAMPMMAVAQEQAPAAAAAQDSKFEVTIAEVPQDKKIGVIKVIREITNLGLKEAKEMAEATPKAIKDSATKAEAEDIKKKLEAAGAKVTLKSV